MQIVEPSTQAQLDSVRKLLFEYGQKRTFDAALGDYDAELESLPWKYARPDGCLLLALQNDQPAGCVAYRKIEMGICEMKRLYVSDAYLGFGVGKKLTVNIIDESRKAGYKTMRLDTHPSMLKAQRLYQRLGFKEIGAYNDNPTPGIRFFELSL